MNKSLPFLLAAAFAFAGYCQTGDAAPAPLQSTMKEASEPGMKTMQKEGSGTKEMPQQATGSGTKSEPQKEMNSSNATKSASAPKGEKPAASDGWIVVEEDFWYPFRYSLADAIHNAHVNFRTGRMDAASDEIQKAMSWMKLAKGMAANKESEEDIDIAINDLRDLSMFLGKGQVVQASVMNKTLARAANALAKHHKFHAVKSIAKEDMTLAARHLNAAAFNIREAAHCANHEYGNNVVEVVDDYGAGYFDETAVVEKNKLEQALDAISSEIGTLEKKVMKAGK